MLLYILWAHGSGYHWQPYDFTRTLCGRAVAVLYNYSCYNKLCCDIVSLLMSICARRLTTYDKKLKKVSSRFV
jgi:hypothetical protein